jgi:hypothetical protein
VLPIAHLLITSAVTRLSCSTSPERTNACAVHLQSRYCEETASTLSMLWNAFLRHATCMQACGYRASYDGRVTCDIMDIA